MPAILSGTDRIRSRAATNAVAMTEEADLHALCLKSTDVARLAEFLDGDADAAFEFVRRMWLPDASRTAIDIMKAILNKDSPALSLLCRRLRDGARRVGATRIMWLATEIERSGEKRNWRGLSGKAYALKTALDTLGTLLLDCG